MSDWYISEVDDLVLISLSFWTLQDDSNKMFIMLYFRKQDTAVDEEIDEEMLEGLDEKAKQKLKEGAGVSVPKAKLKKKAKKLLKPCVYKKR